MTSVGLQTNTIYNQYPQYKTKPDINFETKTTYSDTIISQGLFAKTCDAFELIFCKSGRIEKFNELFPNNEINQIYLEINKDFNIDIPAKLNIIDKSDSTIGGGYRFAKNEINLNLEDLMDSNTKIIGIKNGKKTILTSPIENLPLFASKKDAEKFVKKHSKDNFLGFDKLTTEKVTPQEHKKFIIQKLAHEIIHSQQHMIMRQAKNIGTKSILNAWNNNNSKNMFEKYIYEIKTNIDYLLSPWTLSTNKSNSRNNTIYQDAAENWLNAIKNYKNPVTKEYDENYLETDANKRAHAYIKRKYGDWN